MTFYTIGVQFWGLFFRKFRVISHDLEGATMLLRCADGSLVSIPGMDRKVTKIYPDYRVFLANKVQYEQPTRPHVDEVEGTWPDLRN